MNRLIVSQVKDILWIFVYPTELVYQQIFVSDQYVNIVNLPLGPSLICFYVFNYFFLLGFGLEYDNLVSSTIRTD